MIRQPDTPDAGRSIRAWRGWMALWFVVAALTGVGIGHLYGRDEPGSAAPTGSAFSEPAAPEARMAARRGPGDAVPLATTPSAIRHAP